jgi:hypothetical protein
MYALIEVESLRIASSASLRASGKAARLVYAAARLLYARGSDLRQKEVSVILSLTANTYGNRLMASV